MLAIPPVIFAAFFAGGYLLDHLFPLSMDVTTIRHVLGGILCPASAVIAGFAFAAFLRAGTPVDVRRPAVALVTIGPYRFSRNPMYLSLAMLYGGVALLFDKPWTLAALVPCLVVVEYGVIRREERYLESRFGDVYRAYRAKVRRWL